MTHNVDRSFLSRQKCFKLIYMVAFLSLVSYIVGYNLAFISTGGAVDSYSHIPYSFIISSMQIFFSVILLICMYKLRALGEKKLKDVSQDDSDDIYLTLSRHKKHWVEDRRVSINKLMLLVLLVAALWFQIQFLQDHDLVDPDDKAFDGDGTRAAYAAMWMISDVFLTLVFFCHDPLLVVCGYPEDEEQRQKNVVLMNVTAFFCLILVALEVFDTLYVVFFFNHVLSTRFTLTNLLYTLMAEFHIHMTLCLTDVFHTLEHKPIPDVHKEIREVENDVLKNDVRPSQLPELPKRPHRQPPHKMYAGEGENRLALRYSPKPHVAYNIGTHSEGDLERTPQHGHPESSVSMKQKLPHLPIRKPLPPPPISRSTTTVPLERFPPTGPRSATQYPPGASTVHGTRSSRSCGCMRWWRVHWRRRADMVTSLPHIFILAIGAIVVATFVASTTIQATFPWYTLPCHVLVIFCSIYLSITLQGIENGGPKAKKGHRNHFGQVEIVILVICFFGYQLKKFGNAFVYFHNHEDSLGINQVISLGNGFTQLFLLFRISESTVFTTVGHFPRNLCLCTVDMSNKKLYISLCVILVFVNAYLWSIDVYSNSCHMALSIQGSHQENIRDTIACLNNTDPHTEHDDEKVFGKMWVVVSSIVDPLAEEFYFLSAAFIYQFLIVLFLRKLA